MSPLALAVPRPRALVVAVLIAAFAVLSLAFHGAQTDGTTGFSVPAVVRQLEDGGLSFGHTWDSPYPPGLPPLLAASVLGQGRAGAAQPVPVERPASSPHATAPVLADAPVRAVGHSPVHAAARRTTRTGTAGIASHAARHPAHPVQVARWVERHVAHQAEVAQRHALRRAQAGPATPAHIAHRAQVAQRKAAKHLR